MYANYYKNTALWFESKRMPPQFLHQGLYTAQKLRKLSIPMICPSANRFFMAVLSGEQTLHRFKTNLGDNLHNPKQKSPAASSQQAIYNPASVNVNPTNPSAMAHDAHAP